MKDTQNSGFGGADDQDAALSECGHEFLLSSGSTEKSVKV